MLKLFVYGATAGLLLRLGLIIWCKSAPRDRIEVCDGDCYDCHRYGIDCEGNDADYLMWEEEDDEYFGY